MASLCGKNLIMVSLIKRKRLCRFLSGSLLIMVLLSIYGDASVDTGVGYTGLVGQINGVTVVWRSIRQSRSAFSTIETEAQALVDLM